MKHRLKFGLSDETIKVINAIFQKYPQIETVLLYGSRAKGNFREGSDIDLVIKAPTLTTHDLLTIENAIDDLMLPYKVDLSLYHQIEHLDLLEHINRVGVIFFQNRFVRR